MSAKHAPGPGDVGRAERLEALRAKAMELAIELAALIPADEPDIAIPAGPPHLPRDPDPAQSESDREWAEHGDDPSYFGLTGM